jgi:glycosyltransferase involved in cell wall biosynthesis
VLFRSSEFVREEVIDHFGVPPERVSAIHHGVPPVEIPPDNDSARLHRLVGDAPYVLALGPIEPRKDVPALVRAFDSMATASDATLVIAGPDGWGADAVTDAIASASHRDRVVRLGYVSAADRSALLRSAHVFAYPSIYEGFGFPPLEAMSVGVPVVATRTGALAEVLGDAARFVERGETGELAGALEQLLSNEAMRADLVERGRRHVERYRWDRTAQAMVQLYERAAA